MAWTNGPSRTNTPQWKALRRQATKQLDYRCQVCGREDTLELDHIINHARGGEDTLDNLQWLCRRCHGRKTQQEAAKARTAWKRKPEVPPWEQ